MATSHVLTRSSGTGRQWLGRWVARGLIAVVALCIATLLAGMSMRFDLARQYPPPGQLVDVGGYRLHLSCAGTGGPTVVMDAGASDFSLFWASVQPEVAQLARVCTYDRAGLGWSELSPHERTSPTMARELHTLLERAQVPGPYVLVGHSLGGLNMRLFARQYPGEVAGMVLVDAAHEEQDVRLAHLRAVAAETGGQFRMLGRLSALGLLAFAPEQIPARGLPDAAAAQYRALLASSGFFAAAAEETAGLEQSFAEARSAGRSTLGPFPVVVLSRGVSEPLPGRSPAEGSADEQIWRELQLDLAARAPGGTHLIAERSGHYIQLQQPELVVAAIRQVLTTAQLANR
jgi:pimeloyl-ACP methyl ester carboxylesterase